MKVFLGRSLLKKVSLAASRTRRERFVHVKTWRRPHRGTIRIVTTSRKPVVVEGLGVVTRPVA